MAITLTTLQDRVYTRLRAEISTPSANSIHTSSIERWANEKLSTVIEYLRGKPHYLEALQVVDYPVTLTSGSATLPLDFAIALAVKAGANNMRALLQTNLEEFANYDHFNFEKWFAENEELVNQSLKVVDSSLNFSSGTATLPDDYGLAMAIKADVGGVTKKNCTITYDPQEFAIFDSFNFLTTPTNEYPIVLIADRKANIKTLLGGNITGYLDYIRKPPFALIANGKLYIKPTSHTSAKLDYVKEHPPVSAGTLWADLADEILVELIMAEVYAFLELPDLALKAEGKARMLAGLVEEAA